MMSYKFTLTPERISNAVNIEHFGANFREMFPNIGEAYDLLDVTNLRYPAGGAQEQNITFMPDGELNERLVEFLDWVVDRGTPFTLSIPVGEKLATQEQMIEFVDAVYQKLGLDGHLLKNFEIGNEYWSFQEASEYGNDASKAAEYLFNAIEAYNNLSPASDYDPKILVQTAPPWRVGQDSSMDKKNMEIIRHFDANRDLSDGLQATVASEAIDGIVSHYYYNKGHDADNSFSGGYYEYRAIDSRSRMWDNFFGKELDYHVTEWNVQNSNFGQQGLKAASVILEQFENMISAGVDAADVWSVLNRNYNAFAGGITEDSPVHLSPAGQVFAWMRESLIDDNGQGLSLLELGGIQENHRPIEINAYTNGIKTVLYVSSRTNDFGSHVGLNLSYLAPYSTFAKIRKIGILEGSSDGLSDRAVYDNEGQLVPNSRNQLRVIDEAEKLELERLLSNLFKLGILDSGVISHYEDGTFRTYLPPPSTILLKPGITPNTATSLDDFYFAGEVDVTVEVEEHNLDSVSDINFVLDPYEVVEITLVPGDVYYDNYSPVALIQIASVVSGNVTGATDGSGGGYGVVGTSGDDVLNGGGGDDIIQGEVGNDSALGSGGDDFLFGGLGDDRLDGGSGDDTLLAGDGDDFLFGGVGQDVLSGGAGDDLIKGGDGDDFIDGGDNNDILEGGRGNDTLVGGSGADVFVFRPGEGVDTILDFEEGLDLIRIDQPGVSFEDLTITSRDGSTVVSLDDSPVAIVAGAPISLLADDFVFM